MDHLAAAGQFLHFRLLGLVRKRRDPVDLGLDVVEGFGDVGAQFQLGRHHADIFGGHRADPVDAVDALDLLFDTTHDALFDLFGRGPQILDADLNHVEAGLGKDLLHHVGKADEAHHQDQEHQQVRRDAVARHPGNGFFHSYGCVLGRSGFPGILG